MEDSSMEQMQEKVSVISKEPINDNGGKSIVECGKDNLNVASDILDNVPKHIEGQDRSQKKIKHLGPGPSNNSNTCFRPIFHHHHRGGPYRQNNFRMNMNSIPPRFPMLNFSGDPRSSNPSFLGFRPNRFPSSFPQGPRPPPRFFKPNEIRNPRLMNPMPHFLPRSPLISSNTNFQATNIPQKVLINPNFKGGVEAVKSELLMLMKVRNKTINVFSLLGQIMKNQMFSSSNSRAFSEEELLRKQEDFINQNVRQIQKRRSEHDRSPSPRRHRSRSISNSPPRQPRKYQRNDSRRQSKGSNNWNKHLPEEDEETRAYREKIEMQRRKREEVLRQKEIRRKQLQADKSKQETQPSEQLKPIVVTDKKIVLKKLKSEERSTTPPLKEHPNNVANTRRIVVLKPSKNEGILQLK